MRRFAKLMTGFACALLLAGPAAAHKVQARGELSVHGETFVLSQPGKKALSSRELVGAVLDTISPEGARVTVRIDSVTPSKERPDVLLHTFSMKNPVSGAWIPFCDKDAYGRRAGFPVAGTFRGNHFIADRKQWFLTCTSGSQGKCILWGYDPWKKGPKGENLVPYYEACQHMVRADYDGRRKAHTRDGTEINMWDHIDIQHNDTTMAAPFEAGWAPEGAVCVAKTRWADLLTRAALIKSAPRLAGPCNEKIATAKGAILFNQSRINRLH